MIALILNDGGRAAAGYKGSTGDCVTRAIAIAAELPYRDVYEQMAEGNANGRLTARRKQRTTNAGKRTARAGIYTKDQWFKDWMVARGWVWTPTMKIGSGCKVHLSATELPMGRIIVRVTRHYAAVIDGVLHDTHDSSRNGTRCVYGYWSRK